MLIILAGITLNAVIGEGGIIFQARDTRNKISNETTYDNAQLAQLQNELKDNGLYSGIGIIPGTDNGGGSEGGENGTGSTNQGGSTNTGGNPNIGKDAEIPNIVVLSGEELAEGIYQSDITVQILNGDKTQKIKYVLATTVDEINEELYPSGLIKELEIENGGTLTFTKAGEYTITAYAYDTKGNKSEARSKKIKRLEGEKGIPNPPIFTASGIMGEPGYYSSNITVKVEAETFTEIEKITYVVTGQAKTVGKIGNKEVAAGENILAEEVEIGNEETFEITADGIWIIKGYTYDTTGKKSEIAKGIIVAKDTIVPVAGVPIVSAGERGEPGYYRSDVTVKIQGYDDIGLKKVTYVVTGETKSSGTIGEIPVGNNQSVDTGEIEIENNGTFTITGDGIYNITAYSYDKVGNKSAVSETLTITRDTVPPVIESFEKIAEDETSVTMKVTARDDFSGLATIDTYTYYLGNERKSTGEYNSYKFVATANSNQVIVKCAVKDKAGNTNLSTTDVTFKNQVDYKTYFLADMVTENSQIKYDCGTWPSNTAINGKNFQISGFGAGLPKGSYLGRDNIVTGYWRVIHVIGNGEEGQVEITPTQYDCQISGTVNDDPSKLLGLINEIYGKNEFAEFVRLPSDGGLYGELSDRGLMHSWWGTSYTHVLVTFLNQYSNGSVTKRYYEFGNNANKWCDYGGTVYVLPIVRLKKGVQTKLLPESDETGAGWVLL